MRIYLYGNLIYFIDTICSKIAKLNNLYCICIEKLQIV